MTYFIGAISLFFGLVGIAAAQAGLAVGIMFLMHKKIPDRLPEKHYGDFDFDMFDKPALQRFLMKVAAIFLVPTLVLHMTEYLILYKWIVRHWGLVLFMLFVFEMATITFGLFRIFRLDPFRLAVLASSSAVIYLFFQRMLIWTKLLI